MRLTDAQVREVAERARRYLDERYDEGRGLTDILADIYCEELEDKTEAQGRMMAESLMEAVAGFGEDYRRACEQRSAKECIRDRLLRAEAGMDDMDRCNLWLKHAAGAAGAGAELNGPDAGVREALIDLDQAMLERGETSKVMAEHLREQTQAALMDCRAASSGMQASAKLLSGLQEEEMIVRAGNRTEYSALLTMLVYVGVKRGKYAGVPVDITLEQTAALVCSGIEQLKIVQAIAMGQRSKEQGEAHVKLLDGVLGSRMTMGFRAGAIFGLLALAPVGLAAGIGVCFAAGLGARAWNREREEKISMETVNVKKVSQIMRDMDIVAREYSNPRRAKASAQLFYQVIGGSLQKDHRLENENKESIHVRRMLKR